MWAFAVPTSMLSHMKQMGYESLRQILQEFILKVNSNIFPKDREILRSLGCPSGMSDGGTSGNT